MFYSPEDIIITILYSQYLFIFTYTFTLPVKFVSIWNHFPFSGRNHLCIYFSYDMLATVSLAFRFPANVFHLHFWRVLLVGIKSFSFSSSKMSVRFLSLIISLESHWKSTIIFIFLPEDKVYFFSLCLFSMLFPPFVISFQQFYYYVT